MANDNQGGRTFLAIVLGGIVLALVIAAYFMYGNKGDTDVKVEQPKTEESVETPVTEPPPPAEMETPAPAEPEAPVAEDPSTPDEEPEPATPEAPAEAPAPEAPEPEAPAPEQPAPEQPAPEQPAPQNP